MSITQGGCGIPFLAPPVYDYLSTGHFPSNIIIDYEDVPYPNLRFVLQKVRHSEVQWSNFSRVCVNVWFYCLDLLEQSHTYDLHVNVWCGLFISSLVTSYGSYSSVQIISWRKTGIAYEWKYQRRWGQHCWNHPVVSLWAYKINPSKNLAKSMQLSC